ncbi:MAG: hypothetical protein CMJ83_16925 [Planctomycetes bacterium]|nr:hypothetical protein [Planctomycetota bacterium]
MRCVCESRHVSNHSGNSLVEVLGAITLFSVGMLGAFSAASGGTAFSRLASEATTTDSGQRNLQGPLRDLLTETSTAFVDTSMRVHSAALGFDLDSDRFFIPQLALRQCISPVCAFHTNPDSRGRRRRSSVVTSTRDRIRTTRPGARRGRPRSSPAL